MAREHRRQLLGAPRLEGHQPDARERARRHARHTGWPSYPVKAQSRGGGVATGALDFVRAQCELPDLPSQDRVDGQPYRPFCSERCSVVDLAAWADGRYRIAGEPVPEEPEQPDEEPTAGALVGADPRDGRHRPARRDRSHGGHRPYVVVDGPVRIGARTRVMAHAFLTGDTALGADNVIHPGAILGHEPQDLAYSGRADRAPHRRPQRGPRARRDPPRHAGRARSPSWARDNYLMSHAHIAHNCRVGDRTIICSGALVAGHVVVRRPGVRVRQLRRAPARPHRPARHPARALAHQPRRAALQHHGRYAHGARVEPGRSAAQRVRRRAHPGPADARFASCSARA